MSILRVKCSKCTRVLKVPGKYAGRVISCPGCKQKLRVPEPVMDAQIVDDDEFDDAPAPRPRTQAKRRSKAATAPKDDKMTASDWVAGVLLFAIGPVLVALYAMRGNPKWKPLLAVSAGMYLLVACVAYWQSDTLVDYLAWQGKEEQRINKDGPRSSFSDGLAYDPAQDDFSEEDQQVADAIREELERRQESAEAMAAPPSAADLNQMDAVRQRAFRANVRIDVEGFGLGSGIVCQIDNGAALILTNRHVVDPNFEYSKADIDPSQLPPVRVTYVEASEKPGKVVWVANDGVDLALVKAGCPGEGVREADWRNTPPIQLGEKVFAVGNPVGLGWTYTQGSVSALRTQTGKRDVQIVQVDATINRGNSGGGLYNDQGRLIGINNFIIDPAYAQNTGFAIRANIISELKPPGLNLNRRE